MQHETLILTDLPQKKNFTEPFLAGALEIVSRSGLHPTERLLLTHLSEISKAEGPFLFAGNRTGATAMAAALLSPARPITCHIFDLHHARSALRNFTRNAFAVTFAHDAFVACSFPATDTPPHARATAPIRVACTSAVPTVEPGYAAALFMTSATDMTGELILDQLEDIYSALAPNGICLFAYSGDPESMIKHVQGLFPGAAFLERTKTSFLIRGIKRGPLAKRRNFHAVFTASLPGFKPLEFSSLPGVFCHRRPDNGGLALAEVAVRELTDGRRLIDIGCGCGLDGILLATAHPAADLLLLDSHARALAAAHENLEALRLAHARLLLSDDGTNEANFDFAVGNPPYFSDYKIADSFIATAADALRPEGLGFFVAKTTTEIEAHLRAARFNDISLIPRRGYKVVRFC